MLGHVQVGHNLQQFPFVCLFVTLCTLCAETEREKEREEGTIKIEPNVVILQEDDNSASVLRLVHVVQDVDHILLGRRL